MYQYLVKITIYHLVSSDPKTILGNSQEFISEMYDGASFTFQSIPGLSNHISIYTGHYNVPEFTKINFVLPGKTRSIKLISDGREYKKKEKKLNKHHFGDSGLYEYMNMDDDDDEYCNVTESRMKHWMIMKYINPYFEIYQDLNDLQRTLVTLLGVLAIITVYIMVMVWFIAKIVGFYCLMDIFFRYVMLVFKKKLISRMEFSR